MSEPASPLPLTADDLSYLTPEEGRCELVAGQLVREPPPGQQHGAAAGWILVHVGRFVLERRLGQVYAAETGFLLARNPDTVRCPDAAFVSAERLAKAEADSLYFAGAPDLAVEVLSPSNTRPEALRKVSEYLTAGGTAVWVVDPGRQEITVHTSGRAPRTFGPTDTLEGDPALSGFHLPVAALLAGR